MARSGSRCARAADHPDGECAAGGRAGRQAHDQVDPLDRRLSGAQIPSPAHDLEGLAGVRAVEGTNAAVFSGRISSRWAASAFVVVSRRKSRQGGCRISSWKPSMPANPAATSPASASTPTETGQVPFPRPRPGLPARPRLRQGPARRAGPVRRSRTQRGQRVLPLHAPALKRAPVAEKIDKQPWINRIRQRPPRHRGHTSGRPTEVRRPKTYVSPAAPGRRAVTRASTTPHLTSRKKRNGRHRHHDADRFVGATRTLSSVSLGARGGS